MTNVIDLSLRRAVAAEAEAAHDAASPEDARAAASSAEAAHSRCVADTLIHLANTGDAIQELLRACSREVAAGALERAKMALALAVVTMLGPDWELARYGDE